MAYPIYSRTVRFIGNRSKKEVHDTKSEKTNCQIDEVFRAGHAVGFSPDTLAQARSEGYDNCAYCLGGSTR